MAVKYNIQDYITICKLIQSAIIRYFTLNVVKDTSTGQQELILLMSSVRTLPCSPTCLVSLSEQWGSSPDRGRDFDTDANVTPPFGAAAQH